MRPFFIVLLSVHGLWAQSDPGKPGKVSPAEAPTKPATLLPPFDSATVWEGVAIKTGQVYDAKDITPSFKLKKRKSKRTELINALEAQFQVNIAQSDIRKFKRASQLADYIYRSQFGLVTFSKSGFQGKVERLIGERSHCDDGDCLNYLGSVIVPMGTVVTFYDQPDFKGAQMVINALQSEIRLASFFKLRFGEAVSTTDPSVKWREAVRSLKIVKNR
ncbi:MAG: hypothetical protein H6565_04410 [Lewinellaceae bacterium]|nr:hypothetical protein [Lewinellaceae bacterium]